MISPREDQGIREALAEALRAYNLAVEHPGTLTRGERERRIGDKDNAIAALYAAISSYGERVTPIQPETPEWTPLMLALEALASTWESEKASTDDLINATEDAIEAWQTYRVKRFGAQAEVPA